MSDWTGKCSHCPRRFVTRWELEEHERRCTGHAAVTPTEALAEAEAGVDGRLMDFHREEDFHRENGVSHSHSTGTYLGYMAKARLLIRRLQSLDYTVVPVAGAGEGAGKLQADWAAELDAKNADALTAEAIPAAKVGQVWVSPLPRVEPRTVVKIVPTWDPSGVNYVWFRTPSGVLRALHQTTWSAWVRKSCARPQEPTA